MMWIRQLRHHPDIELSISWLDPKEIEQIKNQKSILEVTRKLLARIQAKYERCCRYLKKYIQQRGNSKIEGSASASEAGQETEASDESLDRSEEISEVFIYIRSRTKGHFQVIVPTEPKKVWNVGALDQVPDAIHFNPESQRTTKTLYVGNLDYNSDNLYLCKALKNYFWYRAKVASVIGPVIQLQFQRKMANLEDMYL
jgi:hypothetical protein